MKRATCIKSAQYTHTHYIAVAETLLAEADKLYVTLYNKLDSEPTAEPLMRYEIKLPKIESDQGAEVHETKKEKS